MKYAVVEHAGKQFVAAEGQVIEVDRLDLQTGSPIEFGQVLLLRDADDVKVGSPYVGGARVTGQVEAHIRGAKITVFKYRPKQRYRVRSGHRQPLSRVVIQSIGLPGEAARPAEARASAARKAEPKAEAARKRAARRPAAKSAGKAAQPAKPKGQPARKKPPTTKKPATKKSADKKK